MNFSRALEELRSAQGHMSVFVVPWDSEIFGFPVAQIEAIEVSTDGDPREILAHLRDWLDRNAVMLASCRIASRRLRELTMLEDFGFRFIETVYSPSLAPPTLLTGTQPTIHLRTALPSDVPAIEAIAETAFATGRFALDSRLDPALSARRYRTWVSNSLADPRHVVLAAILEEEVAGFFIIEQTPERTAYWHLTAVAPAWQGRGIGRQLWQAVILRHMSDGLKRIETTVSGHNAPVLNLYSRLGFRFDTPKVTLHWHRR